jgi:hypothetical protein
MPNLRQIATIVVPTLVLTAVVYLAFIYWGVFGQLEAAGEPAEQPRPAPIAAAAHSRQEAVAPTQSTQILFGDLHAHTTFSIDAFQYSLALMGGEGAHPPADACDFARYCSALDFWSINDHAEHVTPDHWMQTKESIRQCNAAAGDPANPDMVAFLGWEWTHAGTRPDNHYGHKNVVLRDTAEDRVPARPIAARGPGLVNRSAKGVERVALPLLKFSDRQRAFDFTALTDAVYSYPDCPEGVPVRELPAHCRESAATPAALFAKLDDWGYDALVIPHGNSWGVYTPAATTWDKQLQAGNHRADYQFMIEAFSGHGNSEQYRDWRATEMDAQGRRRCPQPTDSYLPSCWRAGQLIAERCEQAGGTATECELQARRARQLYVDGGQGGWNVVGGTQVSDWLDSGQCRDCFLPAFNYRPGGSAQYALSLTNFDDPENPRRFNFALMASSDNHTGSPGTGYKEFDRYHNTETSGVQEEFARELVYSRSDYSSSPVEADFASLSPVKRLEHERSASFFYTGGLVAVHAPGRDRDSIWGALQRKQIYGTSGERILLWFDLIDADGRKHPMGSELSQGSPPRFRVSAVGSFKQKPGCPVYAEQGLGEQRLQTLCRGECYNPGDERKLITRIEIVRIRPQMREGEPMQLADGSSRIEDVWKTLPCEPSPQGCTAEFVDEEFAFGQRDTIYYARAIQEPGEYINAGNLRAEFDENGNVRSVKPCYSDNRTDYNDNCLAVEEARAWSSPIFVNYRNPLPGGDNE